MNIRDTAFKYCSGGSSLMFEFASSGYIKDLDGLITEIEESRNNLFRFMSDSQEEIEELLHAIKNRDQIRYDIEDGFLMAPWCGLYDEGSKAIIPEHYIIIASDNVYSLRRCDLDRVFSQCEDYGEAEQLARFIVKNRLDLVTDIDDVMLEFL